MGSGVPKGFSVPLRNSILPGVLSTTIMRTLGFYVGNSWYGMVWAQYFFLKYSDGLGCLFLNLGRGPTFRRAVELKPVRASLRVHAGLASPTCPEV